MWNPLLSAMADVVAGPVLDDMVSEVDMGRVVLTCHFSSDVHCSEMHQPHVFLPQVLSLDLLIPVNEVSEACVPPDQVKSVQILSRSGSVEGRRVGVWMGTFLQLEGGFSIRRRRFANWVWRLSEVVFHGRLLGGSFAGMGQGGCVPGTGEFGQWTCSNWSVDVLELWQK